MGFITLQTLLAGMISKSSIPAGEPSLSIWTAHSFQYSVDDNWFGITIFLLWLLLRLMWKRKILRWMNKKRMPPQISQTVFSQRRYFRDGLMQERRNFTANAVKLRLSCTNRSLSLQWRHNGHDSISNHQPHDCLLNRVFRRRSKEKSKLRVTGLCAVNSPGTGEFPAQMASYRSRKNVSIWWRHHERYKRRGALTVRVLHSERRSEPIGRWWGRRHRNVGRPSVKRLARARHRPKNGVKYNVSDGIRDMIVTSETWKCTPTSQIAKRLLQHGKTVRNST